MDEKAPDRGKIDFLGLASHSCVTRQRLLDAGVGRRAIQQALEDRRLHRIHAGVYAVGRPLTTPLEHAAAAVLACGERTALGGLSALAFHDLPGPGWPRTPVVLVARRVRRPGIEIHFCTTLARTDVRTYRGIRATTPERTLLDTASRLAPQTRRRAVGAALRRHLTSRAKLRSVIARNAGHPGAKLLAPLLAARTKSPFEDDFLTFCTRYGLPTPQTLATPFGYEVDAWFPQERVIVELDSEEWHLDPDAFRADHERDLHHTGLGVLTVRLIWEHLQRRPAESADRLHHILAARRTQAA